MSTVDKNQSRLRRAKRTRIHIRQLGVARLSVHRTGQHIYAQVIDDASGEALLKKVQGWWDSWDKAGKAAALARNSTIVTLDKATREQWERTLVPMFNKAMVDFEGQGVGNAREIYIEMQRQVARYQKA